jgi:hypothetical protein
MEHRQRRGPSPVAAGVKLGDELRTIAVSENSSARSLARVVLVGETVTPWGIEATLVTASPQ